MEDFLYFLLKKVIFMCFSGVFSAFYFKFALSKACCGKVKNTYAMWQLIFEKNL